MSYNGQRYHGWQSQRPDIPTVQQALTSALAVVADMPVVIHCAGRTDTGVHATKQVVHFDSTVVRPEKAWVLGVNAHLDDDVAVEWAGAVSSTFDARRTATSRRYLYFVYNTRVRSALMPEYMTHEHRPLDSDAMHAGAQALLGENDFSSFRAANCQSNTPMRNVHAVSVTRQADLVIIDIEANAFLHHMVRNISGVLIDVGAGVRPVDWVDELLQLRDRTRGGVTAPPNGLYLADVKYPTDAGIPSGLKLPHFLQIAGV